MDELFDVLRAGTAAGSTPVERQAAAAVCRAFLIALEATPGQPLLGIPSPEISSAVTETPSASLSTSTAEASNIMTDAEAEGVEASTGEVTATSENARAEQLAFPSHVPAGIATDPQVQEGPAPTFEASIPFVAQPASPATLIDAEAVERMVRAAQALPREQLLDLAIAQMRARLQAKGEPIPSLPSSGVRFHLVPIPSAAHAYSRNP